MFNKEIKRVVLFMLLLLSALNGNAEIYKWTDEKGKVHFSDRKPGNLEPEEIELRINTYESVSYDMSIFNTGKKVVMYSADWCAYCKKAKKYFVRKSIPFTEYDIEKNREALNRYKQMGATGVPVILVGSKRMNGFSEKGFEKIYR